VYTPKLTSVTSRFNLHTAMIPVGAVNRRTSSMVCRLTCGRCMDMKYESHNFCVSSSKNIFHFLTARTVGFLYHTLPTGATTHHLSYPLYRGYSYVSLSGCIGIGCVLYSPRQPKARKLMQAATSSAQLSHPQQKLPLQQLVRGGDIPNGRSRGRPYGARQTRQRAPGQSPQHGVLLCSIHNSRRDIVWSTGGPVLSRSVTH